MSYESLPEFFYRVNQAEDPAKELATANKWHQIYLIHAFQFKSMLLPQGAPPHKPQSGSVDIAPTKLLTPYGARQLDKFYNPAITQMKREHAFIQFIEGLSEPEATCIIEIKDKMISEVYPKITPELVDTVFPNLIPPHEVK